VVVVFNLVIAYVLEKYEEQVEWSLAAFSRVDVDGSGTVDAAELRSLLAELGQHPSVAEVEEMVAEIDANHDGHLSEQEFVQLLSHRSSHRYMELLHKHSVGWACDLEMEANAHH
jgi:Ca2+-binding EF-hand superfamily protein